MQPAFSKWLAVVLLAVLALPVRAAEPSLEDIFNGLVKTSASTTRFIEQKTIAEFEAPIESTGELNYQPPARLEKRTLSPAAETLILNNDVLIVERDDFRREIAVADMPAVGAFVASLRGFVSGDLAGVQQAFSLTVSGTAESWTIDGKPIDAAVKQIVDSIQVIGAGDQLKVFAVVLTSGDTSTLTLIQ